MNQTGFWRLFLRALRQAGVVFDDLTSSEDATGFRRDCRWSRRTSPSPGVMILDDAHVLRHPKVLRGLETVIRGWEGCD